MTLCECGCGREANISRRFIKGHVGGGFIGHHHSTESKTKNSEAHKGNKHWNWQNGISFIPYCQRFNRILKTAIKERDNHTCQLCGATDKKLAVHHVHYDKENCYPDLITLCRVDNCKVNSNRKHYESLFMNKLNDRGLLFWTKFHQYP